MLTKKHPSNLSPKMQTPEISRRFVLYEVSKVLVNTFALDPVNERDCMVLPGVVKKHTNLIPLIRAQVCFVYSRYCFRQNFEYSEMSFDVEKAIDFLRLLESKTEVGEIILSGEDPLAFSNSKLFRFMKSVWSIRAEVIIWFHTRSIVASSKRFDEDLFNFVSKNIDRLALVFYIVHPEEIDLDVGNVTDSLRKTGVIMFCQSILSKGVNYNAVMLRNFFLALFRIGVVPYLNILDKAREQNGFMLTQSQL